MGDRANDRSVTAKERFRRAARKVKNYWIFTRRSSFEGFFASKGSAFALPDGDFARRASKHGGEMQMHLQSMVNLLRDDDILRLVVKLEGASTDRVRYLTVVSAFNEDDIEESIAVGVDWVNKRGTCTIGMVLPLWRDTKIELDGDGGFKLSTNYKSHILKPVSVQTMWTAVQWIHRCSENARKNNQFPNGLSHQWSNFYSCHISSDQACVNEWHEMEDISSKLIQLPTGITPEEEVMMKLIRHKLKEVMMKVDLEEVTSRMIRNSLEDEMKTDLKKYKQYIDEEMLTIFGQMDSSSQVYDHVYLGSEWNASNLEELRENGIGYILNITREIDNFYNGTFEYFNIRVYDEEDSDLLCHWDDTYKFINQAKEKGVKVLVHCKMGISRSASTVIAYGMKEYGLSLHDTMDYVKSKRSVVNPNPGFLKQLITYEGILNSSKQRFNPVFSGPGRRRSSSDDLDVRKGGKRRRNRRNQKSKTVTIGEKLSSEPILEVAHASTLERGIFGEDADIEDLDEDLDPEQSSFPEETSEDVLRSWERSLSESNDNDQESPCFDPDEVGDTVGILEQPQKKSLPSKAALLHRAKSVPSLLGKNIQSPVESIEDKKSVGEELHRCTSLHEFLSGKVQKLKEDFNVHSLGRHTDFNGSMEKRSASHPTSPVGEESQEMTKDKKTLQSTLSDPTSLTSEAPISTSSKESEKEDNGSSPDQSHTTVVHRDAQGVVKSGTVKRQSKNFEEGRVNLPWEWEEALGVLESVEQTVIKEDTPDSPSSVSEKLHPYAEDEPPIGVVKLHAQKFQGSGDSEQKRISLEHDEGNVQSAVKSLSPKKLTSQDAKESIPENNRVKEETKGTKELFGKNVSEDIINEDRRRLGLMSNITEGIKKDDGIGSTASEDRKSKDIGEEAQSEDPLPGTVRKHTQAIEVKYQQRANIYSLEGVDVPAVIGTEMEDMTKLSGKKAESSQPSSAIKKGESRQVEYKDTDSFDVDVLLQRVSQDIQREREELRDTCGFKEYLSFSMEESMFEDITPQSENTILLKEQDDENEIPRPGTVRRNTELLLGKDMAARDKTEKALPKESDVVEIVGEAKSSQKLLSSPENGKETVETTDEDDTGRGLVKRNTLVYEGVLPFSVTDVTKEDSKGDYQVEEKELKAATEPLFNHVHDKDLNEESCSGTVKRNTLIFEGKITVQEVDSAPKTCEIEAPDSLEGPVQVVDVECDETNAEGVHDAVDTSSVVNVKLRLNLLEEVIRKANERETHRLRTTKALADLEDKRKQIEMEQTKLDMKNSKEIDTKDCSMNAKDDISIDSCNTKKEILPTGGIVESTKGLEESTYNDDPDSEVAACVGNVRIRTLQLEERIHGSGQPLRRHGSMPRTTRPIDRPVVRQRSLSDLEVGNKPSTSREPISSDSPLVLAGQTDKNKDPKLGEDLLEWTHPDNDRDSEKLSDIISEKSDKTDDDSKTEDIFELQDKGIVLPNSKQRNQIPDQDNKDVQF